MTLGPLFTFFHSSFPFVPNMKDVKLHELFLLFALSYHLVMCSSRYIVTKSSSWTVFMLHKPNQVMLQPDQNRPAHVLFPHLAMHISSTHLTFAKIRNLLLHLTICNQNAHLLINQNRTIFSPLRTLWSIIFKALNPNLKARWLLFSS